MRNSRFSPVPLAKVCLSRAAIFRAAIMVMLLPLAWFGCGHRLTPEEQRQASERSLQWLVDQHGEIVDSVTRAYTQGLTNRLNNASLQLFASAQFGGSPPNAAANYYLAHPEAWQVSIIRVGEANAFSVGSGIIVVSKDLVGNLTSEAAFAAVIAHEMSHHYLGHTDKALREAMRAARHGAQEAWGQVSPGFHLEQDEELAADELAFKILSYAGYDPRHTLGSLVTLSRSRGITDYSELMKDRIDQLGMLTSDSLLLPLPEANREFIRFRRDVLLGR